MMGLWVKGGVCGVRLGWRRSFESGELENKEEGSKRVWREEGAGSGMRPNVEGEKSMNAKNASTRGWWGGWCFGAQEGSGGAKMPHDHTQVEETQLCLLPKLNPPASAEEARPEQPRAMDGKASRPSVPKEATHSPRLRLVAALERFFYWLGYSVSRRPFVVIVSSIVLCTICAYGLKFLKSETRPEKLWIPSDAPYVLDSEWVRSNFPQVARPEFAIFEADNVLTSDALLQMLDTIEQVDAINVQGTTWAKLCLKIPVVKLGQDEKAENRRRRRALNESSDDFLDDWDDFDDAFDEDLFKQKDIGKPSFIANFDPSVHLDRVFYCPLVERMKEACFLNSILEIWSYDRAKIEKLTPAEIQKDLNETDVSPVFGTPKSFDKLLGGVKRNDEGVILSARSVQAMWLVESDPEKAVGQITNDAGTGEKVDQNILLWEAEFVKILRGEDKNGCVSSYVFSGRSFGDISGDTIKNDAQKLSVGFIIMFLFVQLMLGKFNLVEQRAVLSAIGVASVGIGCVAAYGVCAFFGVPFGPVHSVLPFLLLGIGIDDMFVIVQSHASLNPGDAALGIKERMGRTLQHAGVAITVTSLTDLAAFGVGASTTLPSLRSFCIYAAVGILFTYVLQVTFFTAWFSLDLRRSESNRDGCLICIRYTDYKPNACSQKLLFNAVFEAFSRFLFKLPSKVLVLAASLALLGAGSWGVVLLKQEFDPAWFLPPHTYLSKFLTVSRQFYPGDGEQATVYLSGVNYTKSLSDVAALIDKIEQQPVVQEVDSWYPSFQSYANTHYNASLPSGRLNDTAFKDLFGRFIFSPTGSRFRSKFMFYGSPRCLKPSPPIKISSFDFKFKKFKGSVEHVPAMNQLKKIISDSEAQFGDGVEVKMWARTFAGWETDEVIAVELVRNLCLAMICVFCTTFLLIANVTTCLLVLGCVILTLVDVAGFMHWWGLTVDVVSCIDLVLAVGLCVDYAAHIGHAFMCCAGESRAARAQLCLQQIGPAVFSGGFSTFLAFVLLASSDSHVFLTYFKIFFLVVVFGLFHGLLLLPVVLSLVGPDAYPNLTSHDIPKSPSNAISSAEQVPGLQSIKQVD